MRIPDSPSGYGIRWHDIDEDLSVDRLIGIAPGDAPFHQESIPLYLA